MLDKLDGRVPAQDGQQPLPPVPDTNDSQVSTYTKLGLINKVIIIIYFLVFIFGPR